MSRKVIASFFLAVCLQHGFASADDVPASSEEKQASAPSFEINTELRIRGTPGQGAPGWYVTLAHDGEGQNWTAQRIERGYPAEVGRNQEIVFITDTLDKVEPVFVKLGQDMNKGGITCNRTDRNARTSENGCASSFLRWDTSGTANIARGLVTVMSVGLNLVAGVDQYQLDKERIAKAVLDSNTLDQVGKKSAAAKLETYRNAFAKAKSSYDLQRAIHTYKGTGYDPDNLLTKAEADLQASLLGDQKRLANERLHTAKVKEFQAQMAAEFERKTGVWRKKLTVGAETNCGPVIDMQPGLAKIYLPIKDYGNEHWLRLGDLYRPGTRDCAFVNGVHQS